MSHVSVSREALLPGHDPGCLPNFATLTSLHGLKPGKLRGHSDLMWNEGVNRLVARHLAWSDFEVEAKHKNLASAALARFVATLEAEGRVRNGVRPPADGPAPQAASLSARRSVRASRARR